MLATSRRSRGTAAASVQWAAWSEVGMSTRGAASERMADMEEKTGFGRIKLVQGLATLATAMLDTTSAVLSAMSITWSRF